MKDLAKSASVAAVSLFAITFVHSASAQSDEHWEKTYAVSGQPTLVLSTDDSDLNIKSCGACKAIQIHVNEQNHKLNDYRLEETQTGDTIHFLLKERTNVGFHFSVTWHKDTSVAVEVETPPNLTLHAETSDGNLSASGLNGAINLRSSDGRQTVADVSGRLNVQSSDGSLDLRNIAGTLDAHTSDGNVDISGKLDSMNIRTGDGALTLELANGSSLKADSTLHSSDGSVTVRLPKDLSANLDISTSDGKIDCNLPLTLDGFHGGSGSGVKGKLNQGGAILWIHTSDGTVHLSSL
jgi:DUF4097 and DUF4098 domain-containing protein YvlB